MSFNLIDAAKNFLPDDLIAKAAGSLGESESGIRRAVNSSIPAIFSGLLSQSSEGGSNAGLLDLVKKVSGSGIMNNITSLFSGGGQSSSSGGGIASIVMDWLKSLFGSKLNSIISAIAGFAGIKQSSASAALSMAAPAVLGVIGKHVSDNNLNESGLKSFLQNQKNTVYSAVPSGFNLASALGLSSLQDIDHKVQKNLSSVNYPEYEERKGGGAKWLWILLALAAIAALLWLLTKKGCNSSDKPATTDDTTVITTNPTTTNNLNEVFAKIEGAIDSATGDFIYNTGDTIQLDLPNNAGQLKVGKWSTEARLFEFLTNKDAMIDTVKGNWFDLTNVRFKTGGSVITQESYTQLKNLLAIVKAFPNAKFKIGGYTDNTGDSTKNVVLSQKRAEVVASEIVKLGASKDQIVDAKGYGSQFPVGDNSTPEGRAVNRRVSVNVKAK